MNPAIGDFAPDFAAPLAGKSYEESSSIRLSDLRGTKVVLVFYPKDHTPLCRKQACGLRDGWASIPNGVKVFGISTDDLESHRAFIDKQQLPYPLISDPDGRIAKSYGAWAQRSFLGMDFSAAERTTFVIGVDGRIAQVLTRVSARKHLELLLEALEKP